MKSKKSEHVSLEKNNNEWNIHRIGASESILKKENWTEYFTYAPSKKDNENGNIWFNLKKKDYGRGAIVYQKKNVIVRKV